MGAEQAIEQRPATTGWPRCGPSSAPRHRLSPPDRGQGEGAGGSAPVALPPHTVPLLAGEREKKLGIGLASAREAAAAASTLEELRASVFAFEGCALKRTATNTVFADGVPGGVR